MAVLGVDVFVDGTGAGGNAEGHGDVVVDVEFEEVEELVADEVDSAVHVWRGHVSWSAWQGVTPWMRASFGAKIHNIGWATEHREAHHTFLDAKVQLKRAARLVASWKGDVLQPAFVVFHVFAGIYCPVQTADRDGIAILISPVLHVSTPERLLVSSETKFEESREGEQNEDNAPNHGKHDCYVNARINAKSG